MWVNSEEFVSVLQSHYQRAQIVPVCERGKGRGERGSERWGRKGEADRQAGRQAGRQTDRQTDRPTDRQTDKHRPTNTDLEDIRAIFIDADEDGGGGLDRQIAR